MSAETQSESESQGRDWLLRQILTATPDEAVRMAWSVIRHAETVGARCAGVRDMRASQLSPKAVAAHGLVRALAAAMADYALGGMWWGHWPKDTADLLKWGVGGRAVPRHMAPESAIARGARVRGARTDGARPVARRCALKIAERLGGRLFEVTKAVVFGRRLEGFGADGCPNLDDVGESISLRRAEYGNSAELDALAEYVNEAWELDYECALFALGGATREEIKAAELAGVAESDRCQVLRETLLPEWVAP